MVPQFVWYRKLPPPNLLPPDTSQAGLHGVLGRKSMYEMFLVKMYLGRQPAYFKFILCGNCVTGMLYAAQGQQLQGKTKQDTIVFKTARNVLQLSRIMQTKDYKAEGKRFLKHDKARLS
jgi:hypothetical protein